MKHVAAILQLKRKTFTGSCVGLYFSYLLYDESSEFKDLNLNRDLNMKKVMFAY